MKLPRPAMPPEKNKFAQPGEYPHWKPWLALGLAVIVVMLVLSSVAQVQETADQHRNESFSVLRIDRIEQALHRMEAANTGFLLTSEASYREPFNRQRDIVSINYQELLRLTVDDATQQERLKTFKTKLTQWFTIYNPLILRRRAAAESSSESAPEPRWTIKGLRGEDQEKLGACRRLFEEMLSLLDEIRATQAHKAHSWQEPDGAWYQILTSDVFSDWTSTKAR